MACQNCDFQIAEEEWVTNMAEIEAADFALDIKERPHISLPPVDLGALDDDDDDDC